MVEDRWRTRRLTDQLRGGLPPANRRGAVGVNPASRWWRTASRAPALLGREPHVRACVEYRLPAAAAPCLFGSRRVCFLRRSAGSLRHREQPDGGTNRDRSILVG